MALEVQDEITLQVTKKQAGELSKLIAVNDYQSARMLLAIFIKQNEQRENEIKINGEDSETRNVPTATEPVTGDNQ